MNTLRIKKVALYGATAFLMFMPMMAAAELQPDPNTSLQSIASDTGLGTESPIKVILSVVRFALGLLGLISVIIILLGGFRWMTAAGNDENIKKAKKILFAGLTGMVIVLVGLGVVQYVISTLKTATNTTTTF